MNVKRLRRRLAIGAGSLAAFVVVVAVALGSSCRFTPPTAVTADARFGRLVPPAACTRTPADPHAASHVSYPETSPDAACFTPVRHDGHAVTPEPAPPACAFPGDRARLLALATALDAVASGAAHVTLPCTLSAAERRAAFTHDAAVVRALAASTETYPYGAIIVPGHGRKDQEETAIATWLPGDGCRELAPGDLRKLGAMPLRTGYGADAFRGKVAPILIPTGGAVHSSVVEAFAMMHLLQCQEHVPAERILVEPCAEHTHTNLRNGARWLDQLGARAGYVVTDGFQARYLQDWSGFQLVGGGLDQRSLRDWGFVLGAWRQASVGATNGFWLTPYRFWAEERGDGKAGSFTCVDPPDDER